MPNVFISHRTADSTLAAKLANELKSAGHIVWLDTWEVKVGDSILGKMKEGLRNAKYMILCYSTSGVDSPWTAEEWESFRTRQLNGQGVMLIPVKLSGGDPPPILEHLKYADLTTNWTAGVAEVLRVLL